jgi:GAF domain-containing protein/biotin carboxyl carrier protein
MESSSALFELASISLACRDQDTLLKTFAARVGAAIGARGVLVWLNDPASEDGALECKMRWSEPGERFQPASEEAEDGLLAEVFVAFAESGGARRIAAKEIDADALGHLDEASRGRVKTLLYATLPGAQGAMGVVEALNKRAGEFTAEDAQFLEEAGKLAGQALTNLTAIEGERESQLSTLERLTALYDLGRTFTSTLELGELLPIVAVKIRDILGAVACNLWLADANAGELFLAEKLGNDPSVEEGARVSMTEGLLGEVAQTANAKLIEDAAEDEALAERREAAGEEFEFQTWMAAPLRKDDQILGVVELIDKANGEQFTEDDNFFLSSISEQAGVALHNANLLESERKVHALDALLKISQEITSTLDLDHVLTTVVHQASTIIPFDKCVIGFYDRGKFILGAVSGESEVPKTREMNALRERLQWVAEQEGAVSADMYEDGWHLNPEEARAQFASFLEEHGHNGFYALPLRDDQGNLGTLALLSGDADFLNDSHKETLGILANQTTVAIRNAQLYQQLPLMSLFQPLAQRKQKLMAAVQTGRMTEYAQRAALVILALLIIPWPMRVGTDATVVPAERRRVSTIDGGVVQHVFVREGEVVQEGQLLAQLDDGPDRVKLAQASADLAQARRDLSEAEFRNDPPAAGQAQIRGELHTAEVNLEQQRIEEAQLKAPIAGIVVTPKVEDRTGAMVGPGESFCEIVVQDRIGAEMSVAESDLALVAPGESVALKLNAFPTTTFEGSIERVGTQAHAEAGEQYFLVRAVFEHPGAHARDGMVGRARVQAGGGWFHTGWYPVGYVILRAPFRWVWQKAWALLP